MTTIATDGLTMAGDGQTTSPNDFIVNTTAEKVRRTASGRIVGCCGASGDDDLFIDWLENAGKKPRLERSFAAIVLSPSEPPRVFWSDCTSSLIATPYAVGTGSAFALSAMDLGKSPEEAVAYACTRDIYSSGEITVLHLEQPLKAVA
jgi:ATP-dependent protease HslVU (ClpYQ) peptidase subunit